MYNKADRMQKMRRNETDLPFGGAIEQLITYPILPIVTVKRFEVKMERGQDWGVSYVCTFEEELI